RIQEAIGRLDDNQKRLHAEAVAEGLKDEVCPRCESVLLAFQHFLRCDPEKCPMIARNPDGTPKPDLLEQLLGSIPNEDTPA
ncbi:MAG: hypothetical protein WAZ50_00860, partial [Minisyncoccia bacterium]